MYRFIKNGLMIFLLACASLVGSLPVFAGEGGEVSEKSMAEEAALIKDTDVSIYGRFWPRITYKNNGGSSTDITDALSRVGLKANTQITETLSAVLHGEWDVDIESNGDFGDARQAYVGIQSTHLGFVGIGKQWDPHFNITAEVTDIFYHRASPFGYNNEGPFRSNNLVRYANSVGSLNVDVGVRVNGASENNAGDVRFFRTNATESNDADNVDAVSGGVSYRGETAYVGVSYLRQNNDDDGVERNFFSIGASLNVTEEFYLAVTYQYIKDYYDDGSEKNPYTLDVAGTLSFGDGMKALGAFFAHDDDSNGLTGFNLTLIKEVHPSTDIFVEWVITDHDQGNTVNTASLGFRYDFSVAIF